MADDQISDEAPLLCNESIQRHDDINKKFNSKNAKKIALCFVFWFIVIHSCIHLFYGEFKILLYKKASVLISRSINL